MVLSVLTADATNATRNMETINTATNGEPCMLTVVPCHYVTRIDNNIYNDNQTDLNWY